MASIRKEILIKARPEDVWAAVRDVGALHTRLVPGFVVDTRLEQGARVVTFGNGMVARELIVDLDDEARRLAWPWSGDGSRTTTPRCRSSPTARDILGSSGSPTCCPMRSPATFAR
jgi:polyketide cyclase/dehydrase/lipid transport protein